MQQRSTDDTDFPPGHRSSQYRLRYRRRRKRGFLFVEVVLHCHDGRSPSSTAASFERPRRDGGVLLSLGASDGRRLVAYS